MPLNHVPKRRQSVPRAYQTSSTIFPVAGTGAPNVRPEGVPSHSSGTPTLQPFELLIQRTRVGSAFSGSLTSWPGVPSPVSLAAALPRRFGACFLRSRLIVSIYRKSVVFISIKPSWFRTFSSSFRFSLRFFLRRAISARRIWRSSAVKCFLTWGSRWLLDPISNHS